VVSKVYNNPNKAEREDAKNILAWIICCKRPLKWRELQATFCIELASQTVDFDLKTENCASHAKTFVAR
jgi:hypothetical protein